MKRKDGVGGHAGRGICKNMKTKDRIRHGEKHVTVDAMLGVEALRTPTPVFCEKRLQMIDSKGRGRGGESKETARVWQ
jgi:hypothetical protein